MTNTTGPRPVEVVLMSGWPSISVVGLGLWLCACVPHSLPLYEGESATVEMAGSTFLVRYTDTRAEATRISVEANPSRMLMLSRALQAIEVASGCQVLPGTLYGDWSLAEAYLDCPDRAAAILQPAMTHRPPIEASPSD